jgi:hypothetical protein
VGGQSGNRLSYPDASMRNTPPRPPIEKRSDWELIEDLCIALRNVGVHDSDLPAGPRVKQHIADVGSIHRELASRGADVSSRLSKLSEETFWRMAELLEECLAYPRTVPYVREADGIRRYLRCHLCSRAERPPDAKLFWFCEACMQHVLTALREYVPCEGIVLFRTYNSQCRCSHADADTVLVLLEWYDDDIQGVCERCVLDEIERCRRNNKGARLDLFR